jgi:SulP family sulfate permease
MKRISDLSYLHVSTSEKPDVTHGKVPKGSMIYRFEGPLFFGSINKQLEGADYIEPDIKKLVIDLTHVPMIDVTGMLGMKTFLMSVIHDGREVYLCGERDVTGKIRKKIAGEPFARYVHVKHTVPEALKA